MFIKTKVIIQQGSIIFTIDDADNFSGDIDMDSLFGKVSFTLPYQSLTNFPFSQVQGTIDTIEKLRLRKDMLVYIYYKELDFDRTVEIDEMTKIFDGRIDTVDVSKSKTNYDYVVNCEGTMSFTNKRPPTDTIYNLEIEKVPNFLLQRANLQTGVNNLIQQYDSTKAQNIIPSSYVTVSLGVLNGIITKTLRGENTRQLIDDYRQRYGIVMIQQFDGTIDVFSFSNTMIDNQVTAWNFDSNINVWSVQYADATNDFDAVIVYGRGVVGEAVDLVKVASKTDVAANANGKYPLSIYRLERRDLTSSEECQKVARETLLDLTRNQLVSFDTKFDPSIKIGQAFTLNDHDMFSGDEIFFIKKLSWVISKQDFNLTVEGFANSLTTLPSNIVISDTGVADVDYLGVTTKVTAGDWQNFES